ncbi:MAG: mandelate racemase/muconate lactonizing enzyme family protein [Candidatus Latescibacterota bacterium]|jgi:L-alanine-DL-glutamate epimerase-like enolase superfamily enzyme
MKITDIKLTNVKQTLDKPFWNSIKKTTSSGRSRIEIYTDEGIVGMTLCSGGVRTSLNSLRDKLIGEDPLRIQHIWENLYMGGARKPVAKGDYISVISAVDNALWDLKGKTFNQPVWKLLGGVQNKLWAYAAGGYYQDGKGIPELCEEMETYVKQGFTAVKMKVGWPGVTLKHDAERVAAVRKAVGDDVELLIDANNAWDAHVAIRFGHMIEKYDPYWFEEPVHADDLEGSAKVASALSFPVASGENEFTRWGFRDLIERGGVSIVQADTNNCGGISEWMKIAAMASAHHLQMAPHGQGALGCVVVAAVKNGLIVENYLREFSTDLVAPLEFQDGHVIMTDAPGLGIEWNEDLIKRDGTTY